MTSHQLDKPLRDRQTQTIAPIARLNAFMSLTKRHKNMLLLIWRNANARIAHREMNAQRLTSNPQVDTTLVREFDGIAQQIDQDLHQTVAIRLNPMRHIVINRTGVLQVHAFHALGKQVESGVHRVSQGEGFALHLDLACLQLRIVEHIVDDGEQMVGRLARVVQNFERYKIVMLMLILMVMIMKIRT